MSIAQHPYAVLLPLIRCTLWHPDGKPPSGWDERREGSVIRRMLKFRTVEQIELAILGLGRLRETGELQWLTGKISTRVLLVGNGAVRMYELAIRAYWQARPGPRGTGPTAIPSDLLAGLQ